MATRQALERKLARQRRELEALEAARVNYGIAVPDKLDADILRVEDGIADTESQLATLDAESQHYLKGDRHSGTDEETTALMDAQLSRMFQQMDRIETRSQETRDQMVEMRHEMRNNMQAMAQRVAHLEAQVTALQHGPQNVNRTWLLSGAVLLAAMFVLVVLLALRLL